MELDKDIRSTQEVRDLVNKAKAAQLEFKQSQDLFFPPLTPHFQV